MYSDRHAYSRTQLNVAILMHANGITGKSNYGNEGEGEMRDSKKPMSSILLPVMRTSLIKPHAMSDMEVPDTLLYALGPMPYLFQKSHRNSFTYRMNFSYWCLCSPPPGRKWRLSYKDRSRMWNYKRHFENVWTRVNSDKWKIVLFLDDKSSVMTWNAGGYFMPSRSNLPRKWSLYWNSLYRNHKCSWAKHWKHVNQRKSKTIE